MFDLLSPCANCPFRKGQGELFGLDAARIYEIVTAPAFQCHKTVEYGEDDDGFSVGRPGSNPQQCAGLMAILHREGKPNQITQIAERLGHFDPALLDPRNEAYATLREAYDAHAGKGRRGRRRRKVAKASSYIMWAKQKRPKKSAAVPCQHHPAVLPRRPRAVDPVPRGNIR